MLWNSLPNPELFRSGLESSWRPPSFQGGAYTATRGTADMPGDPGALPLGRHFCMVPLLGRDLFFCLFGLRNSVYWLPPWLSWLRIHLPRQEARVRSLGQEDSPGEGNGNPLQYSCLEDPMDRGAWRATVPGVAEADTGYGLNNNSFYCFSTFMNLISNWVCIFWLA